MRRFAVCALTALALLTACATPPQEGERPRASEAPVESDLPRRAPDADTEKDTDDTAGPMAGLLDAMGLRGQIGQRFIIPLRTTQAYARTVKNTRATRPAGYILYPKNISSRQQVQGLTKELGTLATAHTGLRPLIAVDQEGGRVRALRVPSVHDQPSAREMARYGDEAYMEAAGYIAGVELSNLGINMNFAPVLDLYSGEDTGVIGDRALSADPQRVSRLALAYAEGLERGGVVAVGKHFPGHGATTVDSHGRLPRVYASRRSLERTHLRPFAAAIEAGVPALMTAHIVYPWIDKSRPATLSPVWLTEILRRDLGFGGVIVSDAVEMRALTDNYSVKEILRFGFEAGVDLFLITDWIDPIEAAEEVVAMVEHGIISREQVREGARRVLELKLRYGLL
jgi:beta-N-acetylhexosaminidase